jgi:hypothetical protein
MYEANQISRRQFVASTLSTAALATLPTSSVADAQMPENAKEAI